MHRVQNSCREGDTFFFFFFFLGLHVNDNMKTIKDHLCVTHAARMSRARRAVHGGVYGVQNLKTHV